MSESVVPAIRRCWLQIQKRRNANSGSGHVIRIYGRLLALPGGGTARRIRAKRLNYYNDGASLNARHIS